MDYFKMVFPEQYVLKEITNGSPDGSIEFFDTLFKDENRIKGDIKFMQGLFNGLFDKFIEDCLIEGNGILINSLKQNIERGENCSGLAEEIELRIKTKYTFNGKFDSSENDLLMRLFSLKGIIDSLNRIENDEHCFFINKYAIIRTLDNYFDCKIAVITTNSIYIDKMDKKGLDYIKRRKYMEWYLKRAEKYINNNPELVFHYNFKEIEKKSMLHSNYSNIYNGFKGAEKFFLNQEWGFGAEHTMQAIFNFKKYQQLILNDIYNYIITVEEASGKKELFNHSYNKRKLLYYLLVNIELEQNFPLTEIEYRDRIIKENKNSNFNDFKNNAVKSFFGE